MLDIHRDISRIKSSADLHHAAGAVNRHSVGTGLLDVLDLALPDRRGDFRELVLMRKELKARGIRKLTVVYSKEEPFKLQNPQIDPDSHKPVPASYACVPSVAGLILASRVIRDLTAK